MNGRFDLKRCLSIIYINIRNEIRMINDVKSCVSPFVVLIVYPIFRAIDSTFTYLILMITGRSPRDGTSNASCELLFPIALPMTRLTVPSTVCGPVGSVVELYTEFCPLFKDTYPPSNWGIS